MFAPGKVLHGLHDIRLQVLSRSELGATGFMIYIYIYIYVYVYVYIYKYIYTNINMVFS